jgi:nitroreductase
LVDGQERVAEILSRFAGVYGLVRGAPHLLIGVLPQDSRVTRLDLGYVLEQVVLEATRLEVDTCWMTGSYSPDRAAEEVETEPGEIVAGAVALGYGREDAWARLHDGTIRRLVAAQRRLPLEQLVFTGRWGEPWSPEGASPALVEVLDCARLAPSAHNRQPWRFVVQRDKVSMALVEPAPIDGGIAMAHVMLAAADVGRSGDWVVRFGEGALAQELALPPSVAPVGYYTWGRTAGG